MIFSVLKAYFQSLNYLFTKRLFQYVIYTVLLSGLVAGVLLAVNIFLSDDFFHLIEKLIGYNVENPILDTSLSVVLGLILTILGVMIFKYIVLIIASPLLGPLSEKVEGIVTGENVSIPFVWADTLKTISRSTTIAGRLIVRELMFTLPLLLLSLIPVVGFIAIILIFIVQSYYAGIGAIDCYQERNRNVKETIAFARSNKLTMIALGAGFVGMLLIPIAGVLFAPILSTMAGTIVGLKIDNK